MKFLSLAVCSKFSDQWQCIFVRYICAALYLENENFLLIRWFSEIKSKTKKLPYLPSAFRSHPRTNHALILRLYFPEKNLYLIYMADTCVRAEAASLNLTPDRG